jgi:hypothetical protein
MQVFKLNSQQNFGNSTPDHVRFGVNIIITPGINGFILRFVFSISIFDLRIQDTPCQDVWNFITARIFISSPHDFC